MCPRPPIANGSGTAPLYGDIRGYPARARGLARHVQGSAHEGVFYELPMQQSNRSFPWLLLPWLLLTATRGLAQAPVPTPALAQPATPTAAVQTAAGPSAPETAASRPEVVLAAGKGLTVTSADKRFQVTFRSRMQLRESYLHSDTVDTNELSVRTLRFSTYGYVLSPDLKYQIQLAFGSNDFDKDSASPIFDAYLEYVGVRDLNVRFGQYFVPFDRARTIREFALQFVDRQTVVRELTLDRDVGLMLYSTDLFGWGSRLAYNLFLGAGDGKNRVNDLNTQKPSVLIVGRLTLRPFGAFDDDQEGDLTRGKQPRLAWGIAAGYNRATTRDRSTSGGFYTIGSFNYTHAATDLVFKWRGFSLLAEGVLRKANRRANGGENAAGVHITERSRSGFGYFAQVGQMLSDKVELTARWDDLHANKGTDPALKKLVRTSGRQLGGGLNVYLNGHALKLQADYFYIFGSDFDQGSHSLRAQLDATF